MNLTHRKLQGFTIVELMVALALGVVILGSVTGMYIETKRNIMQDEELARMQENARYALDLVKREIGMAGFLGGLTDKSQISASTVATDCASGNWSMNIDTPLDMVNDYISGDVDTTEGTTLTCLTSSELKANSDIFIIKRVADSPTVKNGTKFAAGEDLNQWYLKANDYSTYTWNYLTANIPAGETTPGSTIDYWEYYVKLFYLRAYAVTAGDGIPTLCETQLVNSAYTSRCLVEGIEDLQLEVGVDSNDDGVADQYKATPVAGDFDNAVSIRVHMLVRSVNDLPGYTNNKAYSLGARQVAAMNDGFIRKVFTTTIKLRNGLNG